MDSNTQGFTSYWRNTLADAESGKGAFERKDEESFTQWMNVDRGRLDEEIVQAFFEGEDEQVKTVEVMLRPQVWIRLLKHGKERTAGAPYSYASGYFRTVEPRRLFVPSISCNHSPRPA